MKVSEIRYGTTNTYLIEGSGGSILFDTGWAGSLSAFLKLMGDMHKKVQDIDYILISHFHPDHYGIAQQIADMGPVIAVADVQREYVHSHDHIFEKEKNREFEPVDDEKIKLFETGHSREFLKNTGIDGSVMHTPGHSDDSISLCLDDGSIFVGDLTPLTELELHKGTAIWDSWQELLKLKPKTVYYGHAKTAYPGKREEALPVDSSLQELTGKIMKYLDKGYTLERIGKKTGADAVFIADVARMYLTHTDIGVQGILDRIEIKNR